MYTYAIFTCICLGICDVWGTMTMTRTQEDCIDRAL